jgi:hypothetical protein
LLVPWAAALRAARAKKSDEEVAELFDVSERLAGWRMNGTGARIVAQRMADKWASFKRDR